MTDNIPNRLTDSQARQTLEGAASRLRTVQDAHVRLGTRADEAERTITGLLDQAERLTGTRDETAIRRILDERLERNATAVREFLDGLGRAEAEIRNITQAMAPSAPRR